MAVEEESIPGPPDWVVTFGDMMTLLMCFFILLLALGGSRASDEQVKIIMDSLRRQFGDNWDTTHGVAPDFDGYRWSGASNGREDGGANETSTANAPLRRVRDSEAVGVGGRITFVDDASPLSEQARRDIAIAAEELRGRLQRIEIRALVDLALDDGPTTDGTPVPDSFQLALTRCRSVMQELVNHGIEPTRMRIDIAAADSGALGAKPLTDRSTVEIVMLDELIDTRASETARAQRSP